MTQAGLSRRRLAALGVTAATLALLAACGDEQAAAPQTFPPLDYAYLPKLRLNVASVSIVDGRPPGQTGNADALSPVSPYDALRLMASERLVASGNSGQAEFVIQDASINQGPGRLDGSLAVRLNVSTSGGQSSGFAEAKVVRSQAGGPGDPDGGRAAAYQLVKSMMQDMNVELEYQIKRNLRDYLQETESTVPPSGPVQAEPLAPPPGVTVAPPTAPAPPPIPPAPPPAPALPGSPALPPLSGS